MTYDELIDTIVEEIIVTSDVVFEDWEIAEVKGVMKELLPLRMTPKQTWVLACGFQVMLRIAANQSEEMNDSSETLAKGGMDDRLRDMIEEVFKHHGSGP